MDVIYDSIVHKMTPYEITDKYNMKYNTVRWIVNKYKSNSRVNIKRKMCGYKKSGPTRNISKLSGGNSTACSERDSITDV